MNASHHFGCNPINITIESGPDRPIGCSSVEVNLVSVEIGRRATRAKGVSRTLSVIVIVISSVVLVGWVLSIPFLMTILPGLATTDTGAASCLILAGAALL